MNFYNIGEKAAKCSCNYSKNKMSYSGRKKFSLYSPHDKSSISDSAYKLWDMAQMLYRMAKPYSKLILQGIAEGRLSDKLGVNEENAEMYALFALYGFWGAVYNGSFTAGSGFEPSEVFGITTEFFGK